MRLDASNNTADGLDWLVKPAAIREHRKCNSSVFRGSILGVGRLTKDQTNSRQKEKKCYYAEHAA